MKFTYEILFHLHFIVFDFELSSHHKVGVGGKQDNNLSSVLKKVA